MQYYLFIRRLARTAARSCARSCAASLVYSYVLSIARIYFSLIFILYLLMVAHTLRPYICVLLTSVLCFFRALQAPYQRIKKIKRKAAGMIQFLL